MGLLKKADFLYEVNRENNEVLPIEIELDNGKGSVKMIPLTITEVRIYMDKGGDLLKSTESLEFNAGLISKHLVEPKLTKEELLSDSMKIFLIPNLMKALQQVSGFFTESPKSQTTK